MGPSRRSSLADNRVPVPLSNGTIMRPNGLSTSDTPAFFFDIGPTSIVPSIQP